MARKSVGRRENQTGSIYKDGDCWRAAILVGTDAVTGKPLYRKVRTKSHEEAVAALKRMARDLDNGHLGPASKHTLGAFLESWLERTVKPLRSPSTYRQYEWLVRSHILPHLGQRPLEKVTRKDVQQLIGTKMKQTVASRRAPDKVSQDAPAKLLSTNTLRLIRAVLHSAFSDAIKDGLVARNPAEHVELPVTRRQQPKFLNPEEAAKLLEKIAESDLGPLLSFMLSTGARLGEATGLRWTDVDLEARRVRIAGQLQRLDGKLLYRTTTKTHRDRLIPIGDRTVAELKAIRAQELINGTPPDPDEIVFRTAEGRRIDPKHAWNRLKSACRAAGVPEVSPHALRHTFATLALGATGDLHGVQKTLGHTQVNLTANLYGHATAERLRPTTDAVDRLLRGS